MTWQNLHEDLLELFASDAPTTVDLVRNPRTGETVARGLRTSTSPAIKLLRDAAWKAAHPERVREYRIREFANRRATRAAQPKRVKRTPEQRREWNKMYLRARRAKARL